MLQSNQIEQTLVEIDEDLSSRLDEYENAAWKFFQAKREHERSLAELRLQVEGTVQERQDRAMAKHAKTDAYKNFIVAEATYEANKAAIGVLTTRSSIGQSLLKAQTRLET
jgi:hypothetical protein